MSENKTKYEAKYPLANLENISEEDLNLLSDCIITKLGEMNETETKHREHLKNSFFEYKNRLLFIHKNICELLECFEFNTILKDNRRKLND